MLYKLDGISPRIDGEDIFVAPNASLIGKVHLKNGANIWFNSVLRGDNEWITIGENSNVQDGSVFHTDIGAPLTIGKCVTIGHKVILHGCRVDDNVLIGMGSTILNHTKIGANSIIGANSFIAEGKEIPEGVLALGSPARVKRDLTSEELDLIRMSAMHYVENGKRFFKGLVII